MALSPEKWGVVSQYISVDKQTCQYSVWFPDGSLISLLINKHVVVGITFPYMDVLHHVVHS